MLPELSEFAWPGSQLVHCLEALVRRAKLNSPSAETGALNGSTSGAGIFGENFGFWIQSAANHLGCEAEQMAVPLRDLRQELAGCGPAVVLLSDRRSETRYLALLRSDAKKLQVLTPSLEVCTISLDEVCRCIREPLERDSRGNFEKLVHGSGIAQDRSARTIGILLDEQFGDRRFDACWQLRPWPGLTGNRWARQANIFPNVAALLIAHTGYYLLWVASWALIGNLSFEGNMDRGWLLMWVLLLFTLIPFRIFTTWSQGLIAVGLGGLLKRTLLFGAMRLHPDEIRGSGIGTFLGQAFEAESVEALSLSGGVAGVLATVEVALSMMFLGSLSFLLIGWCLVTFFLGKRFLDQYQLWTGTRMGMTSDLVESMVGHRTRLAQLRRDHWHQAEDQSLENYMGRSRSLDSTGSLLVAAIPRAWLCSALACLAPAISSGKASSTALAVSVGGILLAFTGLKRLTGSCAEITAAWVAWKRIKPLFEAASRTEALGSTLAFASPGAQKGANVIEADGLSFRYRKDGNPVLKSCSLAIKKGDRVLLEGPSGGGKSTLASLISGMRTSESGLLLAGGLDGHTLGWDGWRARVTATPQFHENHILTETLAFNLLMGRRWPPTRAELNEAESLCRDLGLGDLLDRMPAGMLQMVGEGGWQLSHGERSRIYMARALLSKAPLTILDESFASLDPENLRTALECTLVRAETLLVIAHP